jgi:nitrite reductase (cytochrome c-552)
MGHPTRPGAAWAAALGSATLASLLSISAFSADITNQTTDPALWGASFPLHYELYLKTREMAPTRHGGSKPTPRAATEGDPRTTTSQSKVDNDAGLKLMWQGYAFATDFREERGHIYMLEDQKYTLRQKVVTQPGACLNCHASMPAVYSKAGDGDAAKGFAKVNAMPYSEAVKLATHPVACVDCHDAQTMDLRVTRPAFVEGMRALKAGQGIANYDVNKASAAEMRTYVCGQCHVEYYFKGPDKQLTFPWAKGLQVQQIQAYYDELGFRDWTHKDTGAATLKAQHPEFETHSQGVHARAGVACADCHMPQVQYKDAQLSDHWVRSPLLNAQAACVSCHAKHDPTVTAAEMKSRAEEIQDRHWALRNQAMAALTALITDLKAARQAGKTDPELATARYLQRRAQFYLDFVEAENSTGFHAPQESARVLGESIDFSRQGQIALRDPAFKPTVAVFDLPPPAAAPALTPKPLAAAAPR